MARREEKRREERSRWKDEHSRCREKQINRERKDKINTMREGTSLHFYPSGSATDCFSFF